MADEDVEPVVAPDVVVMAGSDCLVVPVLDVVVVPVPPVLVVCPVPDGVPAVEPVPVPVVLPVVVPGVEPAGGAAVPIVTSFTPTWFIGWRKTTVSVPVSEGCWTWTSATKLVGSPHGSPPPGPAVPAIWVTLPLNRYATSLEGELAVGVTDSGAETSEPTSCTSAPVVPVMSTARSEPPSARHVPTFTWTGAVEPTVAFTTAVPPKAGEPVCVVRLTAPVLRIASSTEELSGGSDVGVVTPEKPATPLHVPAGSGNVCAVPAVGGVVGVVVAPEVVLEPFVVEDVVVPAELVPPVFELVLVLEADPEVEVPDAPDVVGAGWW